MKHAIELQKSVQELRQSEFPDLPAELVEAVLVIESTHVDEPDTAMDRLMEVIQAEAQQRAEAEAAEAVGGEEDYR
jgi:hypothetical protein